MSRAAGARAMASASRVQVVPQAALSEKELVEAVRALSDLDGPVRPGDPVGDLVVIRVEPAAGASFGRETEIEVLPAPRTLDAPWVELAILVDVSESMAIPWDAKHTRLEAARVAVSSFLSDPSNTVSEVSILEYAKDARVVVGPKPPRALTLGAAPKPRGRSDTAAAINAALAELAGRTRADRAQSIMLFTDGVGEVAELKVAAARAGRLKVPIHCLVFAPEVDEVFEEIAHASGGSVQQASYPLTIEFVHMPGG